MKRIDFKETSDFSKERFLHNINILTGSLFTNSLKFHSSRFAVR